jgi:hypothetical protein
MSDFFILWMFRVVTMGARFDRFSRRWGKTKILMMWLVDKRGTG